MVYTIGFGKRNSPDVLSVIERNTAKEALWRKHKRRADWHYKTYHNWRPVDDGPKPKA